MSGSASPSSDGGTGTSQVATLSSMGFGHTSSPSMAAPTCGEPPPAPTSVGWPLEMQSGESTGSRYAVRVSTGTSTNVIGMKQCAATVTVTDVPSPGSEMETTPLPSAVFTDCLVTSLPSTTVAPVSPLPVNELTATTRNLPASGCPP